MLAKSAGDDVREQWIVFDEKYSQCALAAENEPVVLEKDASPVGGMGRIHWRSRLVRRQYSIPIIVTASENAPGETLPWFLGRQGRKS